METKIFEKVGEKIEVWRNIIRNLQPMRFESIERFKKYVKGKILNLKNVQPQDAI